MVHLGNGGMLFLILGVCKGFKAYSCDSSIVTNVVSVA